MVLPTSGPISISDIAAEFGIPNTSRFPTDFYGLGGAASSGPLGLSDFYGRFKPTPTPTPAPTLTKPMISPGSGIAGQTTFTATDGTPGGAYDTFTQRWLLNGADQGSASTIVPGAGTLIRQNTATGPGGTTIVSSDPVTVATPTGAQFTPDGGYQVLEKQYTAEISLNCDRNTTWTYSTVSGSGGSVTTPSGGVARGIVFRVTAGGSAGSRFSREQKWTVRGVADDNTTRDFTVELIALGDNL